MSKWRQRANDMADVAVREEDILQKFKINKIKKRSGELSGEKLFKPITRRLEKTPDAEAAEEEEDEEPDYVMDEFVHLLRSSCQMLQHCHQHHHSLIMKLMTTFHHHHHRRQYLMIVMPAKRGRNELRLNYTSTNPSLFCQLFTG